MLYKNHVANIALSSFNAEQNCADVVILNCHWFLDYMVAHLGLRTHELLYEEIGNINAEILSAWEKAECCQEVANHSLIQNINFLNFLTYMT